MRERECEKVKEDRETERGRSEGGERKRKEELASPPVHHTFAGCGF